jgi:simple sugar transport system permease protein
MSDPGDPPGSLAVEEIEEEDEARAQAERAAAAAEVAPTASFGERVVAWLRRVVLVPFLAIVSALFIGAVIIVFTTPATLEAWGYFFDAPGRTLSMSFNLVVDSYSALLRFSLGSLNAFGRTLREMTTLVFAGLSVALAFRAGLFNIGGSGQITVGAIAAAYVGFSIEGLPLAIHLPLALLCGFLAGAVWGGIAGFLKARTGAHEVITTIMLNYIASYLLLYLLKTDRFQRPGRDDPISPPVEEAARLPLFSDRFPFHWGFVLAMLAAFAVWYLLRHTTIGFRMRAVGANPNAARYAGMSVGATYTLSMGLAGGLAGLAGANQLLGVPPSYSLSSPFGAAFIGFDAIALALLGRASPAGVVAASFLFAIFRTGSTGMQSVTETPVDIVLVIQSLIIVFVAAPVLVQKIFRVRTAKLGEGQTFSTNWGAA